MKNIDEKTVNDFGDEWSEFTQKELSDDDLKYQFDRYFKIFNWDGLCDKPIGFDMGCGSGRWAKLVSPRVAELFCIDASEKALSVAQSNLRNFSNCKFILASVESIPLEDESMDFGYSLGVLHHIPNTSEGIKACVKKLKKGSPFLVYLYYAFDNKPLWFKIIWKVSDVIRNVISRMPFNLKLLTTQIIAGVVYYPFARTALILENLGFNVDNIPLSAYRSLPYYSMRTDSLDRFGTKLEHRFTKNEIYRMMKKSGLEKIEFHDGIPYWCAVGYKK